MAANNYIFVYGGEMRGLPGHRILAPFETNRQEAEANGTLYALSAGVPVAMFEDNSGRMVRGELVQIKDGKAHMVAAIGALAQSQGYLGKGDPGNLVEVVEITVCPFGGDVPVKKVTAFAAPAAFNPQTAEIAEGGDWRVYRESANGDSFDHVDAVAPPEEQASANSITGSTSTMSKMLIV